MADMTCYLLI